MGQYEMVCDEDSFQLPSHSKLQTQIDVSPMRDTFHWLGPDSCFWWIYRQTSRPLTLIYPDL